MAPVSTSVLPAGFWDVIDLDEVVIPQGSPSGCDVAHALLCVNATPLGFGGELLYYRQGANGMWTSFVTLSGGLGGTFVPARPWRFNRVSAARVDEQLHICAVTRQSESFTESTGQLAHTVRTFRADLDAGGFERQQFTPWQHVAPVLGIGRQVIDVACAGVRNSTTGKDELHVCAVTDDGVLSHAIRNGQGVWTLAGDVAQQAGGTRRYRNVDCAALDNQLYVVAVDDSGHAWYTVRGATAWRPFEDVNAAAMMPAAHLVDVGIGFSKQGLPSNEWQLVTGFSSVGGALLYTVRYSQSIAWPGGVSLSQWKPMADLGAETHYTEGGGFGAISVSQRPLIA